MSCFGPSAHELDLEDEVKALKTEVNGKEGKIKELEKAVKELTEKNAQKEILMKEKADALLAANKNIENLDKDAKKRVEENVAAVAAAEQKEKELRDALENSKKQAEAIEKAVRAEVAKYAKELELKSAEEEKQRAARTAAEEKAKNLEALKKAAEEGNEKAKAEAEAAKKALDQKIKEDEEAAAKRAEEAAEKLVLSTLETELVKLDFTHDEYPLATKAAFNAMAKFICYIGDDKELYDKFVKGLGGANSCTKIAETMVSTLADVMEGKDAKEVYTTVADNISKCYKKQKEKKVLVQRMLGIIRLQDANGDGVIDRDEYSVYAEATTNVMIKIMGIPAEFADQVRPDLMKQNVERFLEGREGVSFDDLEESLDKMADNMVDGAPPPGAKDFSVVDILDDIEKECKDLMAKKASSPPPAP